MHLNYLFSHFTQILERIVKHEIVSNPLLGHLVGRRGCLPAVLPPNYNRLILLSGSRKYHERFEVNESFSFLCFPSTSSLEPRLGIDWLRYRMLPR